MSLFFYHWEYAARMDIEFSLIPSFLTAFPIVVWNTQNSGCFSENNLPLNKRSRIKILESYYSGLINSI